MCPATFIHPGMDLSMVDLDGVSHQFADFTASAVKIQRHLSIATEIRNNIFEDISLYEPELLVAGHRKKQIIKAAIGDVSLINPMGKFNQGRFGIIIVLKSRNHWRTLQVLKVQFQNLYR